VTTRKPATTPLTRKRLRNVGTHISDANGDIGVFSPHHNDPRVYRVYQRSASNGLTPSGVRSIPIGYLIQREVKRGFEAGMTAGRSAAEIDFGRYQTLGWPGRIINMARMSFDCSLAAQLVRDIATRYFPPIKTRDIAAHTQMDRAHVTHALASDGARPSHADCGSRRPAIARRRHDRGRPSDCSRAHCRSWSSARNGWSDA
jgi:hypothetical protein